MERQTDLKDLLNHIDPGLLDYTEWAAVGMALKLEGYPCSVWDDWSRRDFGRYHEGECYKKWRTFKRDEGVSGGTIYNMAIQQGWMPPSNGNRILSLDDSIEYEGGPIVGEGWAESREFEEPAVWKPEQQLIQYLAKNLSPRQVILGTDVDGVYNKNPKTHDDAIFFDKFTSLEDLDTLEGTTNVDVTGGMVGKIKELLDLADLGIESKIINAEVEDNIFKVLENKDVKGTIISRGN